MRVWWKKLAVYYRKWLEASVQLSKTVITEGANADEVFHEPFPNKVKCWFFCLSASVCVCVSVCLSVRVRGFLLHPKCFLVNKVIRAILFITIQMSGHYQVTLPYTSSPDIFSFRPPRPLPPWCFFRFAKVQGQPVVGLELCSLWYWPTVFLCFSCPSSWCKNKIILFLKNPLYKF